MPHRNDVPKAARGIGAHHACRSPVRPVILIMLSLCLVGSAAGYGAPLVLTALPSASSICDSHALRASRKTGVPFDVLRAVSRTETGRRSGSLLVPWPWTVNMEGKGKWFADRDSARRYAQKHFDNGARSFDVGCFQINYKWHSQAFRSLDEMFDPKKNALYAARYLRRLFDEFGDWPSAVGAFHSRTPALAGPYVARYTRILASLQESPALVADRPAHDFATFLSDRQPLLSAIAGTGSPTGGARSRGSLVPLTTGSLVFIDLNAELN